MKRSLHLVALSLCLILGSPALAEGPASALKKSQVKLAEQGAKAAQKGQHAQAIRHYEAALRQGEANSLHLAVGRSRGALGQCAAAEASFQRAAGAPEVAPLEALRASIDEARASLRATCPSLLTVECDPADMVLKVDGHRLACGVVVALAPGIAKVVGEAFGGSVVQEVDLKPKARVTLKMAIEGPSMFKEPSDDVHRP